ncbi:MAG: hypothetical protein IBJ03_01410 [Gemmatimonadaceae bacterium]|nr:hypothetical protein [Gemmatimonadaceae bacterium]
MIAEDRSKHAIIVLCHRLPDQVRALQESLSGPRILTFLHVDARVNYNKFVAQSSVLVQKREECQWGSLGTVLATLNAFRQIVQSDQIKTVSLISGQDISLRSSQDLALALDECKVPWMDFDWTEDRRRYRYRYHHIMVEGKIARLLSRIRIGFRINDRNPRTLPAGLSFKCGSAWWTLPIEIVRNILQYCDSHPEVLSFFRSTSIPDEMFFQIIVSAVYDGPISSSRRYIDWSRGGAHPAVLDYTDIQRARSSSAIFARKVDIAITPDIFLQR